MKQSRAAMAAWQQRIDDAQDVAVRNVTFVEVLPGRAVNHILPALARICARLRSHWVALVSSSLQQSSGVDLGTGPRLDLGQRCHRHPHIR